MSREIRVPHDILQDNQTIRRILEREFAKHDLDLHRHEVEELEDDFDKGERVLKVKTTKYFPR